MNNVSKTSASSLFHGVRKIVSGGQTGVDQAALDVAIELQIPHGGWCPKGRISENGRIAAKYQLKEMPTTDYAARTQQNVLDSDGTLILFLHRLQGGTALTDRFAREHLKPVMRVRMDKSVDYQRIIHWLLEHKIRVLNVAGPRASSHPDLYNQAHDLLMKLAQSTSEPGQKQLF